MIPQAFVEILVFCLLLVCSIAALFINPRWRFAWLWVPIVYGLVCALYEMGMRYAIPLESVPIRVDLFLIIPMIGFVYFAWIIKCVIKFAKGVLK